MNTICVILLAAFASFAVGTPRLAAQDLSKVPPELQNAAKTALQSGKPYFVWFTKEQPLQGKTFPFVGTMAFIDVFYIAADPAKAPAFSLRTAVDAMKEETKKLVTNFTTSAPQTKDLTYGKITIGIGSEDKLIGAGAASVYIVKSDASKTGTEADALSNVLKVKVEYNKDAAANSNFK